MIHGVFNFRFSGQCRRRLLALKYGQKIYNHRHVWSGSFIKADTYKRQLDNPESLIMALPQLLASLVAIIAP